jgi:hypothetical protein
MQINYCNACLTNPYCVSYKGMENPTASNNERDKWMPSDGTMIQPRRDRSSLGLLAASCTSLSLPHEEYTYLEPLAHEKHQTFTAILKTKVLVRPLCPTYHICCLIWFGQHI